MWRIWRPTPASYGYCTHIHSDEDVGKTQERRRKTYGYQAQERKEEDSAQEESTQEESAAPRRREKEMNQETRTPAK